MDDVKNRQKASSLPQNPSASSLWQAWLNPLLAAQQRGAIAFDEKALIHSLSGLRETHHDVSDFRKDALDQLKTCLQEMRTKLADDLTQTHDGADYVGAHAYSMDRLLYIIIWHVAEPMQNLRKKK